MEFALSMYLGGVAVLATEADYETSRKLGCICASCSEAVFLRAGSIRDTTLRNGKKSTQIVKPSFAHYKGNGLVDCEKRSHSMAVEEKKKKYELEGRNQRLKLYNAKIWDMFRRDRNISREMILSAKKLLGGKLAQSQAISLRKYFGSLQADAYPLLEDALIMLEDKDKIKFLIEQAHEKQTWGLTKKDIETQAAHFLYNCDFRLHKTICYEIVDFLQTRTSGYFWEKLFLQVASSVIHNDIQLHSNTQMPKKATVSSAVNLFQHIFEHDKFYLLQITMSMISSTHWITQIDRELNSLNKNNDRTTRN